MEAVEKERAILERLERIDSLRQEDAPAGVLLEEVRALLFEAEDWVREDTAELELGLCLLVAELG